MLDALIDGEDRHVAGVTEPAVVEQGLEAAQHLRGAVGVEEDTLDVVGPGEHEVVAGDSLALVTQ